MPSEIAVRCDEVVKTFRTASGAVHALRGVSASFPTGAVTAVVGPSGSGKSSLLRLLVGMDRPTSGTVEVAGRPIELASARTRRRLRREYLGYVFQRPSDNFVPHLTVGQHIGRLASGAGDRDTLEALGIGDRADHLPVQLSGGEQQRAAFAQALASGARVIVADEPTAELDDPSASGVIAAMRELRRRGVTLIVASHDPAVVRIADVVVRLDHGELAERKREPGAPAVQPGSVGPPPIAEHAEVCVRVRDLVKTFDRAGDAVHAVDRVSFEVRERELVGLVGRSGSGKTTLLSIVAAWERADAGSIDRPGGAPPAWADVAVVPQNLGLLDELTVRENVAHAATLAGSAAILAERVDELLDALGLSALARRRPSETSVGEQQRAAVARALLLRPRLLIADEPTCHQDRGWTERVLDAIRATCDTGTACLMATHDEAARAFIDRSLVMHDGRIASPSARA